ncbi:monovalent cation/H(+) antiporter subunit G [Rhodohalobacter mucosus]|uniref:Cation:proton antiporter n=1 Tax=Rhodohalobacter mucosus TaxID=2079485 RepID=A0A316TSH1_9BACT|nr:monovalent cation/H(+) antiporter subunit G [Rhodohalobacter mucosus]PWN06818.1 cation:proton antiporter [Rhodohalobacter mucosus]
MEIQNILTIVLVVLGIAFILVGSVGIIRLPDFFTRTHAVSKSDTLGVIFVISGLVIYEGFTLSSLKLVLIILFIALANPVGSHALAKAAIKKGLKAKLQDDIEEEKAS